MSCSSCRYFDVVVTRDERPLTICRRYPPPDGRWPQVFADDWCGEHRSTEPATEGCPVPFSPHG